MKSDSQNTNGKNRKEKKKNEMEQPQVCVGIKNGETQNLESKEGWCKYYQELL